MTPSSGQIPSSLGARKGHRHNYIYPTLKDSGDGLVEVKACECGKFDANCFTPTVKEERELLNDVD